MITNRSHHRRLGGLDSPRFNKNRRNLMKKLLTSAAAVAILIGAASTGMAQGKGGASASAPGTQFRSGGAVSGTTGASGYAPGTQFRGAGGASGTTGASGYAPGHVKGGADASANVGGARVGGGAGTRGR
jgi:hypothetical protein